MIDNRKFITALKSTWIRWILHSNSEWVPLLKSTIHCNTGYLWKRGFWLCKSITNPFWKDILLCWTHVDEILVKQKWTFGMNKYETTQRFKLKINLSFPNTFLRQASSYCMIYITFAALLRLVMKISTDVSLYKTMHLFLQNIYVKLFTMI